MKKPDYKQAGKIGPWLMIPGCILLGFGVSDTNVLMYIGALAILAGMAVMLVFCRCPRCKSYLGRNTDASYCPRCGEKLE